MFKYDKYNTNSIIITKYVNKTYQHKKNVYFWQPSFKKGDNWNTNRTHPSIFSWRKPITDHNQSYSNITSVLGEEHFPLNIHLKYGGTFTKLFMHVSSRNMFPTTRNLENRVHVCRPCHCRGDSPYFKWMFRGKCSSPKTDVILL
jgi:hypothetical protein